MSFRKLIEKTLEWIVTFTCPRFVHCILHPIKCLLLMFVNAVPVEMLNDDDDDV